MSEGKLPEMLGQRILVGIILVGRLGAGGTSAAFDELPPRLPGGAGYSSKGGAVGGGCSGLG